MHTTDELTVGAKLAWYHNTRCIGKLYWRGLTVRDCRHVTDPAGIADECFEHSAFVHNGGRIKPSITIFAPDAPGQARRARAQRPDRLLRRPPQRGRHVVGDPHTATSPSWPRPSAGSPRTRAASTSCR